jgi:hypothetical protein
MKLAINPSALPEIRELRGARFQEIRFGASQQASLNSSEALA